MDVDGNRSSPLPRDLLEALEEERIHYRSIQLRACDSLSREDNLIRLNPTPAADQDWVGGQVFAFKDRRVAWGGEVVHVDAETGDVYLAPDAQDNGRRTLDADGWIYKPFDFSEAICMAARSFNGTVGGLHRALEWVQGESKGTQESELGGPIRPPTLRSTWEQPWGLLWGPPGTGKTEAVASMVADSIARARDRRMLAVATTNKAVDELTMRVCRMLDRGGHLFRDGKCTVFRGGVGTGGDLVRQYPDVIHDATYLELKRQLEALEAQLRDAEARRLPQVKLAELKSRIRSLRDQLADETLTAVQRGRATLITLTVHRALRLCAELEGGPVFHKVILDEAGMISRGAAALILPLGNTAFAAGDPRQIGPISRSSEGSSGSVKKWLRGSPMSHLEDPRTQIVAPRVHYLNVQHRMHPNISRVVSEFAYGGTLLDGEAVKRLEDSGKAAPGMVADRAAWVVLDYSAKDPRELCHDRPMIGKGYVRQLSARLTISLASPMVRAGLRVLAATPYRAQASLIRTLAAEQGLKQRLLTVSTIHRQQGTEYDVVILDTVAGCRPFQVADICTLLNVAASRARMQFIAIASTAEAQGSIPGVFLSLLSPYKMVSLDPLTLQPAARHPIPPRAFKVIGSIGGELEAFRLLQPILSEEQVRLSERRIGEGHFLVRGVAGSGKTYVLARWVARFALAHTDRQILVSYFNKALAPLIDTLIRQQLTDLSRASVIQALKRITIANVDTLRRAALESYDAVFVDEAQDMGPENLSHLFALARRLPGENGKAHKNFVLFMDDSQNVYGMAPIDEFRAYLDEPLSFTGRSRVLREAHRSPRQILDLAFNVVLDPHKLHGVTNPGMREFMKTNELDREGLLRRPEEMRDGLYHVEYTERSGRVPEVRSFPTTEAEHRALAVELKHLFTAEGVTPASVLVVCPMRPIVVAEALNRAGVKAVAFGGKRGVDAAVFPPGDVEYVRVTTVFSGKGHEGLIVFFVDVDQLDGIERVLEDLKGDPERAKRSLFYVGATRAVVRQHIWGTGDSRFVQVAAAYAELLGRDPD